MHKAEILFCLALGNYLLAKDYFGFHQQSKDKVEKVKIAGAFGTHVDREKALIMGLFPDCEKEKIISIGNAAGDGARAALLNREKREEANWISRNVEYIELTVEKDFQQQFMEAMQIPHMKDQFEHLKGIVPENILNQK